MLAHLLVSVRRNASPSELFLEKGSLKHGDTSFHETLHNLCNDAGDPSPTPPRDHRVLLDTCAMFSSDRVLRAYSLDNSTAVLHVAHRVSISSCVCVLAAGEAGHLDAVDRPSLDAAVCRA